LFIIYLIVFLRYSTGYSPDLLSGTFSKATFGNGLVAIFAGILANWVVSLYGYVAPFVAAVGFFAIAGIMITITWNENYGGHGKARALTRLEIYTLADQCCLTRCQKTFRNRSYACDCWW
jgi:hypothetical protein